MNAFSHAVLYRKKSIAAFASIIFFVILVALPFMVTKIYYIHVLVLCMMYACITSAWNMIAGYAGVFSFGF